MTCPCLYPMIIKFVDGKTEISKCFMPTDELDTGFEPPKVNYNKLESINPLNHPDIKLYIIEERISIVQTDEDGDKNIYWSMTDDEIKNGLFTIPDLDYVTQNGKEYVSVIWENIPEDSSVSSYPVNGHLVYAGCAFEDLKKKGNKMVCKDKSLFVVLHPKEEWEHYHVRTINT